MKGLVFDPAADQELWNAVEYHELRKKGLGRDLLLEFEIGLSRILEAPEAWAPLVHERMRRYLLKRFPYAILYKNDPSIIYVLAFMHLSRRPGYWRGRG